MKTGRYLGVICALWASIMSGSAAGIIGMEGLSRLDKLPEFKESIKVGSISSYDRTGGNDDGFSGKYSFVRKEADALVIADLKGPGVIYRVWTPTPTEDWVEFLFDGETEPRIRVKFREMFLGKDPIFPSPLVSFGAGGYVSYVPIPFAKSCVVRVRAEKVQFYQINYALYGPETAIETFSPSLPSQTLQARDRAQELLRSSGTDVSRFVIPPGAKVQASRVAVTIPPRATRSVFQASKPGRIVGLRFSPAEAMSGKARDLLLKITFDGEEPAVYCPMGDFFGYAWGRPAMRSLVIGTAGETNYCYFPMPFDRSASVEVISERTSPAAITAEVLYVPEARATNEGKFYAVWRRENPTKEGEPYTFIETTGRGHLVGVVLQAQGLEPGKTLFFEGDDETTIDGELAIHGTGSEDFFNGGWYDVPDRWEKRLSFPLSGCLDYLKPLGRTGAYRLFLGDAYAFRHGIRQTIEHSGEKNNIPTDYCSVTYLYSDQRPSGGVVLPPLESRGVQDPKEAVFPASWQLPIHAWSFNHATLSRKQEKVGTEEVRFLALECQGSDWFGPHFLSPICDLSSAGKYRIYIEALKGPNQGKVQLFQNENPVSDPVDLYSAEREKTGRLLLGELELSEGKNNLMFKLVEKNEKSSGLALDLIQIICVRE
jgi:hypothetical protein